MNKFENILKQGEMKVRAEKRAKQSVLEQRIEFLSELCGELYEFFEYCNDKYDSRPYDDGQQDVFTISESELYRTCLSHQLVYHDPREKRFSKEYASTLPCMDIQADAHLNCKITLKTTYANPNSIGVTISIWYYNGQEEHFKTPEDLIEHLAHSIAQRDLKLRE